MDWSHYNSRHHSVSVSGISRQLCVLSRVMTHFRLLSPVWVKHNRFKCPQRGSGCFPACGLPSQESFATVVENNQVYDVKLCCYWNKMLNTQTVRVTRQVFGFVNALHAYMLPLLSSTQSWQTSCFCNREMGEFKVHRVRFFDYMPSAIRAMAFNSHTERLALARADGALEIFNFADRYFQEKVINQKWPSHMHIYTCVWEFWNPHLILIHLSCAWFERLKD